ncbi:uncharacterized protein LOC110050391 [Orbicella faveolata]|uniref:uncharacterized protein LOC110050391 n=1 Tax=Orbicella faveolata TaxID=48498 RepID=UPI0009E3AE64|nr:uncharacterized protein LOC110050391 [Orbicella faveolata]
MSSFLSRYGRPMLYGIVAASGALYLWYQFSRKKQTNVDELIGLERRRRVEKLVELRDKLEQLLGSLDNFEPETPDTEDDEVGLWFYAAILRMFVVQKSNFNHYTRPKGGGAVALCRG